MDKITFLPLGSVVEIKGDAKRKAVIIARGMAVKFEGGYKYFDYGGCLYPIGYFGNQILYFNREDINEVVHLGYKDELDDKQVDAINKWISENDMERGNVQEIKNKRKTSGENK